MTPHHLADLIVHDDQVDVTLADARDGAASGVAAIAALLLAVGIMLGLHGCSGAALLCDSLSLTAVVTACAAALSNR